MKIGLLQADVLPGAYDKNVDKLLELIDSARGQNIELFVAPYDAICAFINVKCDPCLKNGLHSALNRLAITLANGPALLCGIGTDTKLLLHKGKAMALPSQFFFNDQSIVLGDGQEPPELDQPATIYIDAHSWPQAPEIEQKLRDIAMRNNVWACAVELTGGYGQKIFAGQSFVCDPAGELIARAAAYQEECLIFDTANAGLPTKIAPLIEGEERIWLGLVNGVHDFIHKAGFKKAILGLSGGMDSALVACIAKTALGKDNVIGVLLPSPYTSPSSIKDALELAENLGIQTLTLKIEALMATFSQTLAPALNIFPAPENDLTFENLQARIRGVLLMALANRSQALVLNTGNKSELAMGYCTLYGDTVGALSVIGDLLKTQVYQLARWYCEKEGRMIIPQNIFDKEPSAELKPNQKDSDSLPPYAELDPDIERILSESGLDNSNCQLAARIKKNRFKRAQCPPVLLISGLPLN